MIRKIIFDENIPKYLKSLLEERGFDVANAKQKGLLGKIDSKFISLAKGEGRVIVSRDKDFIELWHQKKEKFPVVVLRIRDQSKENLGKFLLNTLEELMRLKIDNSLIISSEEKIRIFYSR